MSKNILSEVDKEIAKNKPASWARLMWQGVKAKFAKQDTKLAELKRELNELREFINSPDEMNRHL
ncbi:hypothetical protein ABF162_07515 [Vibrio coralliilyticus]|uniref:hypothetical protein n=1 Tax=Vibrio coralliilyticus TaxID=190893 RepID=UPI00052AD193|nr:hypothetical protein [Vibrio coralliilyticus]AIU66872.1 hypothetical protein JV59_31500 [Vibrio coralliilyticus]